MCPERTEYRIATQHDKGETQTWAFSFTSRFYLDPHSLNNRRRRARVRHQRHTLQFCMIPGTPTEQNCVVFGKKLSADHWDVYHDTVFEPACKIWWNQYQEQMTLQTFLAKTFGLGRYGKKDATPRSRRARNT